jgi:hypothetical protein
VFLCFLGAKTFLIKFIVRGSLYLVFRVLFFSFLNFTPVLFQVRIRVSGRVVNHRRGSYDAEVSNGILIVPNSIIRMLGRLAIHSAEEFISFVDSFPSSIIGELS